MVWPKRELPFSSAYKWNGLVMDVETVRGTYILGGGRNTHAHRVWGSDLQVMVEIEQMGLSSDIRAVSGPALVRSC